MGGNYLSNIVETCLNLNTWYGRTDSSLIRALFFDIGLKMVGHPFFEGCFCLNIHVLKVDTPPETNIAPENRPLEKEIPIGNHHFQVLC